ncbi:molybdopterin molybdotransferase [Pseudarthrobacter oxydans]|uniref:molybdopterin molybdotransferase MoeA n=1 Tax=Pseudarthrobacter oxydans TaxID=1671 RepID=UPI00278045AF|nr:gephyrin-like molybdotransferase Glp [Pseudarthrobacter oxydans]MDP9981342.1 molybdopterin molybdotransferase [Pseudarthrobacter oxydans]
MHRTQTRHVTVEAHRESVRQLLAPLRSPDRIEVLPLLAALGRGLAADVVAPLDLPPFANSQMDGFAIRSADVPEGGTELRVVAPVPAGAAPPELAHGTAAPIMTGAMLPPGADAVVPIEQALPAVFPAPGVPATVRLPAVPARNFIRDAGSDIRTGELALAAGTHLGPGQLGLLAALGFTEVPVYRVLRILLATTGDEVVEPGSPLGPGKIYDSNATLLESSMRQAGLHVTRTGISTDRPEELAGLLRRHAADVDLIVTTGGVSKGAYEVVRQAMEGHNVDFFGVAMQPGGPQGIGTFDGVPVLGFPGNPVSCLVSFEMFLRPALGSLFGSPAPRPVVRARLAEALASPAGKHQVRRGTVLPDGTVRLEGGAGSHLVSALAHSNALIQVPEGIAALAEGSEVEVWML